MSSQQPWDQPLGEETAQRVLTISQINPANPELAHWRVLDFGCGNGRYMEVYSRYINKANIYGVEIEPEREVQVRAKGFNFTLLNPKSGQLPYPDQFFDIVFSSNVIEHIPHPQYLEYLKEIYRTLKPGGRFVVGTPNYPFKRLYDIQKALSTRFFKYYLFDDPTHCNKLSIWQLEKDLAQLFIEIKLDPTYLFFEAKIPLLQKPHIRSRLRVFGDKIFGYCVKPGQ